MKPIFQARPAMLCKAFLASLAAAATLTACGPGTGGTGTGSEIAALNFFGATPASVCNSNLASNLPCPSPTAPGQPINASEGTQVVNYADTAQGGNISVAIAVNSIVLDSRCAGLHFSGDWGIAASNDARFFGTYTLGASNVAVPATLSLAAVGAGRSADMQVTVREASGRVVLGPVTLQLQAQPASATGAPAACP